MAGPTGLCVKLNTYLSKAVRKFNDKGQLHCEDGPAVLLPSGTKYWYRNGKKHREDGPAMLRWDGTEYWYLNGEMHCTTGPAIRPADGPVEWYWHDQPVDFETFCQVSGLGEREKLALVLRYNP